MYKRCERCVMDNASDVSITFDEKGYCNYCRDTFRRLPEEYIPGEKGKAILEATISQIKKEGQGKEYDCVVGISGGIDSSYILYLGHLFGLKMLAIHIDDGLDNPIASKNIIKLTEKTDTHLVVIKPNHEEYADILLSLFKASVPNLAIAQDNLIIKALQDYTEKYKINYSLDGSNFAHESILERGESINNCDGKYIRAVQKKFGSIDIKETKFMSLTERYIGRQFVSKVKHFRPLNYVQYVLDDAIAQLHEFCEFEYYGGKHYESILTRFLQCYYLPEKFGIDKRKSHFSSLIVSGQMSREEALERLDKPLYTQKELLQLDKHTLAEFMNISVGQLDQLINLPPKRERDYTYSILNDMAPLARRFRRYIE